MCYLVCYFPEIIHVWGYNEHRKHERFTARISRQKYNKQRRINKGYAQKA